MSRRTADDEDLYGRISPCPIPPNPSKKQPGTFPQKPSLKWLVYGSSFWNWIKSPEFAGLCGLIAAAATFFGLAISLFLATYWFDPYVNYLTQLGYPNYLSGPFGEVDINQSALFYNGCQFVCGIFLFIMGFQLLVIQIRRWSVLGVFAGLAFIIYAIMGLCYGIWGSSFYALLQQFELINQITFNLASLLPFLVAIAFAPIFLRQDGKAAGIFILFVVIGILAIYANTFVFLFGPLTMYVLSGWLLSLAWIVIFSSLLVFRS
jgi:hypothetical protein